MFSQTSVCPQRERGRYITYIMHHGIGPKVPPSPNPCPKHQTWEPTPSDLLLTSGGHHGDLFKLIHLRTYPPPVLTSSDCHRNTYSRQAGGIHPTGMLSYLIFSPASAKAECLCVYVDQNKTTPTSQKWHIH